jgi:hypothetical protein
VTGANHGWAGSFVPDTMPMSNHCRADSAAFSSRPRSPVRARQSRRWPIG